MAKREMKQIAVIIESKTKGNFRVGYIANTVSTIVNGKKEEIVITAATPASPYMSDMRDITMDDLVEVFPIEQLRFNAETYKIENLEVITIEYETEDETETEIDLEPKTEESETEIDPDQITPTDGPGYMGSGS